MNIYLDIDGVLLIDDKQAAPYADDFLHAILTKYPDATHWLTTHNWRGKNRAKEVLAPHLSADTVRLLDNIKPSEWGALKTDAINFEEDFLWFDDDLWPDELQVLENSNASDRFVMVDLSKDPEHLKKLTEMINTL